VVEFALVLPLLLLLLFGLVDFGRALAFWNNQTHLANEAARYAVVNACPTNPCAGGNLATAIQSEAESSTVRIKFCYPAHPDDPNPPPPSPGEPLHVTVRDTFHWIGRVKAPGLTWDPADTHMVTNSQMRIESATHDKYSPAVTTYDSFSKTCKSA